MWAQLVWSAHSHRIRSLKSGLHITQGLGVRPFIYSSMKCLTITSLNSSRTSATCCLLYTSCLLNACQPASQNPRIYDSGISQELAELRKQEIYELKYDLRLSIPKQKSMPVEGEIHVRFRLNKAQEVILDFREEADKIKEVSANGLPTSYEFRNEHIILPKNTTQKGENDIYIRFTAGNQSLNRNDEFLYTLLAVSYTHLDVYKRQSLFQTMRSPS